MAAVDLPINDAYLSHLHQVRNQRKAAARASSPQDITFSTPRILSSVEEMETDEKASEPSEMMSSQRRRSLDVRASDTAILTQYPSSLVRLLVLLGPLISLFTHFVRLATWTAGPGTASHSFLLLLAWWSACLYGYEIIRYAPQAILLSVIIYNGLVGAVRGIRMKRSPPSRTASSKSINLTIDDLSVLADFFSTLSSSLLEPAWALFSWKSVDDTKALTIFLITTWPIWLLCFGQRLWDVLGLPRVGLEVHQHAVRLFTAIFPVFQRHTNKILLWSRERWPAIWHRSDRLGAQFERVHTLMQAHLWPIFGRLAAAVPTSASLPIRLSLLPPFPLFSLSVRHLLLALGTLALTWCSPWCALIRHALWRSALVRQSTRRTFAVLSGRKPSSLALRYNSPTAWEQSLTNEALEQNGFTNSMAAKASTSGIVKEDENITRHEDVIYQFTVFENQRWWMGLDWTAALLPQERPSWADESNNPVSPPSSFSLPPSKISLKPSPSSSNPKAYVKRLVRWQWIDPEWTVAGREGSGDTLGLQNKSRRDSTSSATTTGTLFSNSTTGATGNAYSLSDSGNAVRDLSSDLQSLDVDAEGWQYGDNSWEKMSKKGGLGRYTRRRRWMRRAVLLEVVQKNYTPTEEELHRGSRSPDYHSSSKKPGGGAVATMSSPPTSPSKPSSPTLPSSPRSGDDLKQRLARATQGSTTVI